MLSTVLLALAIGAQTPPPVLATPYVATSGKTIAFQFRKRTDGSTVTATQSLAAPTITKNGQPLGPLIVPWVTGNHTAILWAMPAGTSVGPADVVTVSAPAGWMQTTGGLAAGMDSIPADNRAGRSAVISPDTPRTLRPGWNNAHLGSQSASTYSVPKNWRYRCESFGPAWAVTYDPNGKPIAATQPAVAANFYAMNPQSGVDQTISVPVGLWAVGWDDLDPARPTTCAIGTNSPKVVSVVERPDLANPGANGVGIVKVYEVKQAATTPQDTGSNAIASLKLTIANSSKAFKYDGLVVYGPGDFAVAAGTPTVLDRSDPLAISAVYLDRMKEGAGSLRWVDSLFGYAGMSQESEPEQLFRATDFTWGLWSGKVNRSVPFSTARPWDQAVTPYIYTTLFGSPYAATLGADADAAATVLTVPDAATAPVIIGLRLKADDELMRVLAVDGTSVTVERGACSTTAAPHSAGPIQVQNRWLATGAAIPRGQLFELVSATPHGFNTGQAIRAAGPWPVFAFADGTNGFAGQPLQNAPAQLLLVTGPNTVAGIFPGPESPWVTLKQSYALDPACKLGATWPDTPALPVEFVAKATAAVGADLHINVPHAASDSLVDRIAVWVRDNTPPGRRVYVEYTNEPWNLFFVGHGMIDTFSRWLFPPSTGGWEFYVLRSTQVWKRFQDRFGDRKGEICGLINVMKFDSAAAAVQLEYARKLGTPAGAVAIAPYNTLDAGPATQAAAWQYDDEQLLDMYSHDLCYNTKTFASWLPALTNVINAYNASYGEHVRPYAYEGGVVCPSPIFNTTITAAVDPAAASIAVASAAPMVPGVPLLCEGEWMTVVSATGFQVAVARGQFGTTAAAHAAGAKVRTAYLERSHDLLYNPNFYFAEQDFYGLLQANGFIAVNSYALSMGAADPNSTFGAYHIQTQPHGRGDGSDGLADNRLTLARPGLLYSKSGLVNQDAVNVSVRGQAFIDWMRSTKPGSADPNAALKAAVAAQLQTLQASTAAIQSQVQAIQSSTGIDDPLAALQANTAAIAGQLKALQDNAALIDGQIKALQAGNSGVKDQLKAIQDGAATVAGQIQTLQQAVAK